MRGVYVDPRRARRGGMGSLQIPQQSMYDPRRPSVWPVFPMQDIPAVVPGEAPGQTVLNPAKDAQKWFWLALESFPLAIPVGGGAAISAFVAPPEEGLKGDLEIVKLMSTSTGDFAVELNQTALNREFMNNPIPQNFVFGTSQLPSVLFETVLLQTTTSIRTRLVDLSGAPNTIRLVAAGRRFLDYGTGIDRDAYMKAYYGQRTHPYWLTFDAGSQITLAGGATNVEFTATVPGAGDLEVWLVMTESTGTYNIEILEGRSARALMSAPLPARDFVASPSVAVAGFPGGVVRAASFPFAWTFTALFKRNSRVRLRLTDTSGAPNTVRLAFHGRLIYYDERPAFTAGAVSGLSLPVPAGPIPTGPASLGPRTERALGPVLPPHGI